MGIYARSLKNLRGSKVRLPCCKGVLHGLLVTICTVSFALFTGGAQANNDRGSPPAWAASWATASKVPSAFDGPTPVFNDTTLRQIVRLSVGGRWMRVWLTNEFGTEPLRVSAASVGIRSMGSALGEAGVEALTFGGEPGIVIPPGARVSSDPLRMTVPARSELAISMHLPDDLSMQTSPPSYHVRALQTSYIAPGNQVSASELSGATTTVSWFYLAAVDVRSPVRKRVFAAFGDSITDGDQVGSMEPVDENARYTDFLGDLLLRANRQSVAVINLGISGNQVASTFIGENMLARLDRDVLTQTGVTDVIVLGGINDLGLPVLLGAPAGADAATLIAVHEQIVRRAKARGLTVIGGTLTPSGGTFLPGYNSQATQLVRAEVNDWIRNSGAYDVVVDFDRVLRDPSDPGLMRADLTADGLHPNSAGYRRMALAVLRALDNAVP